MLGRLLLQRLQMRRIGCVVLLVFLSSLRLLFNPHQLPPAARLTESFASSAGRDGSKADHETEGSSSSRRRAPSGRCPCNRRAAAASSWRLCGAAAGACASGFGAAAFACAGRGSSRNSRASAASAAAAAGAFSAAARSSANFAADRAADLPAAPAPLTAAAATAAASVSRRPCALPCAAAAVSFGFHPLFKPGAGPAGGRRGGGGHLRGGAWAGVVARRRAWVGFGL